MKKDLKNSLKNLLTLKNPSLPYKRRNAAFTLAETLITLAIVGVVAALVLPNFISSYQKRVTVQQLKVAYQIFSEALEKAKADNDGSLPLTTEVRQDGNLYGRGESKFSKLYIEPYIKTVGVAKNYNVSNASKSGGFIVAGTPMCTAKGICYWVSMQQANPTASLSSIFLTVDLNGPKGPNRAGRDVFIFYYGRNKEKTGVEKIDLLSNKNRDSLKGSCNLTSTSIWSGSYCAALIIHDGWKIEYDYPW